MAPKKRSVNAAQENWEVELGGQTVVSPVTSDDGPAAADLVGNPEETSGGCGGLMAMLRKNKEKRKKKGLQYDDSAQDKDQGFIPAPDQTCKAPQEALMDEFALPDKKGKGGGKGKQAAEHNELEDDDVKGGRILTKAEKEKMKREREKQRKKEQAAKKKASGPSKVPEPVKAENTNKESVTETSSPVSPDTVVKKKKIPAHLAAIQKQQEELRQRREEEERIQAEAKARAVEEEHLAAEEMKRREEQKAVKKQKDKERIEQLKKEGKFLTKAQKEEKARNERKLQQMLAAGVKVGPQKSVDNEPKKKSGSENKKRRGKNEQKIDEAVLAEAAVRARNLAEKSMREAEESAARAKAEAEAMTAPEKRTAKSDDDWEATAEADDNVKESWDAESDDGANNRVATAIANRSAARSLVSKQQSHDGFKVEDGGPDESESLSADDPEDDGVSAARQAEAQRKKEAAERREKAHQAALAARSKDNLRSPICCILGHVDTGKTKLLDKVRQTHVQEGEAGGITQQIGATYFPVDAIRQKTAVINKDNNFEFKVPGLLVIDTPGHESFSNLRSRGSSLCNIAILVVDIMHGLEQQTLESMRLLRERKTPFIVALNKIDRLYGWKKVENNGFQESLALQNKAVHNEFKRRLDETKLAFAEQGFNSELFYENKSTAKYVSLVPTSAHTGEGVPDMLKLIVQLTQERMVGSLMYLSEVQATVLEVKAIEGFGMTIDVILSNGVLKEGDRIVLCGTEGAIKTNIRALLTPAPLRELRLKSTYVHNKEVKAALGVKISASGLEGAIAGSRLMVVGPDDDEEEIEDEVESDLTNLLSRVEKSGRGVSVQASTLGSLEALLDFLKDMKIPVANVGIGPVYKRDIMQCGIMLEKAPDYAVMLCFDVKVDREAQSYAEEQGIKIFTADIIYHLFDAFEEHQKKMLERKKEDLKMLAVFPCILKPIAIFNKTSPIVIGVDVTEGQLKIDTPIAAVRSNPGTNAKEIISLGRV
ncbi:hypothetical protein CDD83_3490 [Cordyceps sp. RAO-2017]|nr:hypothetical protein CDD83_3490 [Cordyceps sp. RAO-2017]